MPNDIRAAFAELAEQARQHKETRNGIEALRDGTLPDELIEMIASQLPRDMDGDARDAAILSCLHSAWNRAIARAAIETARARHSEPHARRARVRDAIGIIDELIDDVQPHMLRLATIECVTLLQAEAQADAETATSD